MINKGSRLHLVSIVDCCMVVKQDLHNWYMTFSCSQHQTCPVFIISALHTHAQHLNVHIMCKAVMMPAYICIILT